MSDQPPPPRGLSREILALAVPAFATLVSEPLLLLADSAIIGHLATTQLAGLAVATNIIGLINGLCVFLAYGTTATVSRRLGAGDRRGALAGGIDGIVLAALLGVAITIALQFLQEPIIALYGAPPEAARAAGAYLRIASFGFPFLLTMLASTGVLRGLQDTRTPLKVTVTINLANIALDVFLVYGVGLGIAGSALGTLIAQGIGSLILGFVVIRGARRHGVRLRFHPAGVLGAARSGGWLFLRTISLQGAITVTTFVATHHGSIVLAAHQVGYTIWSTLAFAHDALAIAAQAIVGRYLGAGDAASTRTITRRLVVWGVGAGVVFGILIVAVHRVLPAVFTPDPAVQAQISAMLLVVAALQPIAGVVFVLDGVLIGAGDARYLAVAGVITLVAYLPCALLVDQTRAGLVWLWIAFGVFMLARGVTLTARARGSRWMRLGAR
ncbi:MATE family efflux transporter [Granulicoccus phenolivorans]|uniref:MATE family efflux transporter n=1 Tax=Granulicoccus phenolivorans TaxID=266854 RepID=UPI000411D169|nr:MATE family efflux transporter [Granulicoccus phenolivorans]